MGERKERNSCGAKSKTAFFPFSDMFMDSKFSSRTVAAITNLNGKGLGGKRKEEYKWRKDMEE